MAAANSSKGRVSSTTSTSVTCSLGGVLISASSALAQLQHRLQDHPTYRISYHWVSIVQQLQQVSADIAHMHGTRCGGGAYCRVRAQHFVASCRGIFLSVRFRKISRVE